MRNPLHSLLIAALVLSGCATSPKAPPLSIRPSLDQSLANDCSLLGPVPDTDDFDVLLDWVTGTVFRKYGECAIRHRATVDAWPK